MPEHTVAPQLQGDVQDLTPGVLVDLFELDPTPIAPGETPFYFTPMTDRRLEPVSFNGQAYEPFPIQIEGLETSIRGALPRPRLTVSTVDGLVTSLIQQYNDLLGARVRRTRTFEKYLDGEEMEDPLAFVIADLWLIDRKVSETPAQVEFELASVLDWQGQRIPRRLVLANACPWVYEGEIRGIGGECDYQNGGRGDQSNMYDANDNPTSDPNEDTCGKRLRSCKLRFGQNASLPFGGFPGAQRVIR